MAAVDGLSGLLHAGEWLICVAVLISVQGTTRACLPEIRTLAPFGEA